MVAVGFEDFWLADELKIGFNPLLVRGFEKKSVTLVCFDFPDCEFLGKLNLDILHDKSEK